MQHREFELIVNRRLARKLHRQTRKGMRRPGNRTCSRHRRSSPSLAPRTIQRGKTDRSKRKADRTQSRSDSDRSGRKSESHDAETCLSKTPPVYSKRTPVYSKRTPVYSKRTPGCDARSLICRVGLRQRTENCGAE
jgi:hypothetical protein